MTCYQWNQCATPPSTTFRVFEMRGFKVFSFFDEFEWEEIKKENGGGWKEEGEEDGGD